MLFTHQDEIEARIYSAWAGGARNVMPVVPTGGGKTVIFCDIVQKYGRPACIIAHRNELVSQASLALNREGVTHGIIAPDAAVRQIIALHIDTHGKSFYSPRGEIRVAGVDTLNARGDKDRWFNSVGLVVQDEGHHVLAGNKWGKAMGLFPNAYGLFPTAHAIRADGAGLGRHADGLTDELVIGPNARELISWGFLCDYRLVCPPSDIQLGEEDIGSTGDYKQAAMRAAVHKSRQLVGDVVSHYLRFAAGKLGLTFAADLEEADKIAARFRKEGVPAEVITGETPIPIRSALMRKLRAREILQLVSVDVLGEGTDVPAVEVVSMARPTASFQLYAQQFGRALRINVGELMRNWGTYTVEQRLAYIAASVKSRAIIIDHVGNVGKHHLPDRPRLYTLDRRETKERRNNSDAIPLRTCLNPVCYQPFERYLLKCPYCGEIPLPAGRTAPELVDGDLVELDEKTLRQLRGEVGRIDGAPYFPGDATPLVVASIKKNHHERQTAQKVLRDVMALWGGWKKHAGISDREAAKLFYLQFGIDVLSAQALSKSDSQLLTDRLNEQLNKNGVIAA